MQTGLDYPRITEHPLDVMVPRYEPVTLNCRAEGVPPPTITWYKDGEPLKIEQGLHRMIIPAGLFFLKVSAVNILISYTHLIRKYTHLCDLAQQHSHTHAHKFKTIHSCL